MDPVTNLTTVGDTDEIKAMLTRVIDFLKNEGITAVFTSLTSGGTMLEQSEVGISSLMDTWLLVRMIESASERNRLLYVLKSRGMAHSNQMREFVLSGEGIKLVDVYVGPGTVMTGSARLVQEARDRAEIVLEEESSLNRERELQREQETLQLQAEGIAARLAGIESELQSVSRIDQQRQENSAKQKRALANARKAD
jgi:circadian clock protein KaiC